MYKPSKYRDATVKMSFETPALPAQGLQRHSLNGPTMGTRYSAIFFAPVGIDESVICAALFAAVDGVDQQMSTWKPDSDLSRLNALPEQQWIVLPEELMTVLATALHIGQQSRGAFDIGVGGLVNAWGFGPAGSKASAQQTNAPEQRPHYPALDGLEIDLDDDVVDLDGVADGDLPLDDLGLEQALAGVGQLEFSDGHRAMSP